MQNFQMGAVISLVLLLPAVFAFFVDQYSRKRQVALLSSRSVVFEPKKDRGLDMAMLAFCGCIAAIIFMMIGMAQYGALVKFWPYNLSMTLKHYGFEVAGLGWESFYNSIRLAFYTAIFGTVIIFVGAYIVEKLRTQGKNAWYFTTLCTPSNGCSRPSIGTCVYILFQCQFQSFGLYIRNHGNFWSSIQSYTFIPCLI